MTPHQLPAYWFTQQKLLPAYPLPAAIAGLQGCYVIQYTINASGEVSDPEVTQSIVTVARPQHGARSKADQAQRLEIIKAISAMHYQPASSHHDKVAARTFSNLVVVGQLTLDRPDNPAAVADAKAKFEGRMQRHFEGCSTPVQTH